MAKTAMVCAYIEPELKRQAEARLAELGMSVDEAITRLYEELASPCCEPFTLRIPNAETLEAMREARDGEGLTRYDSLDELKAKFGY